MLVRDIMTKSVDCASPGMTLIEASKKMKVDNVGALPVCENDRLIGMVTDRDIVVEALAEGLDPNNTTVGHIVSSPIIWCFDDQPIEEAAQLMESKQVRRLVVLDRGKKISGILSLADIATRVQDRILPGEILAYVSTPAKLAA